MMDNKKRTYEEIIKTSTFSVKEVDYMKHAIGFDRESVKRGKYFCYRNYFNAGFDTDDAIVWGNLCFIGFANMYSKEMYEVTDMGIKFLEDILSVKIEF